MRNIKIWVMYNFTLVLVLTLVLLVMVLPEYLDKDRIYTNIILFGFMVYYVLLMLGCLLVPPWSRKILLTNYPNNNLVIRVITVLQLTYMSVLSIILLMLEDYVGYWCLLFIPCILLWIKMIMLDMRVTYKDRGDYYITEENTLHKKLLALYTSGTNGYIQHKDLFYFVSKEDSIFNILTRYRHRRGIYLLAFHYHVEIFRPDVTPEFNDQLHYWLDELFDSYTTTTGRQPDALDLSEEPNGQALLTLLNEIKHKVLLSAYIPYPFEDQLITNKGGYLFKEVIESSY